MNAELDTLRAGGTEHDEKNKENYKKLIKRQELSSRSRKTWRIRPISVDEAERMKEIVEETVRYLITHVQLLSKLPRSESPLHTLMDTQHRIEFMLDKVHELLKRVALKFDKIDRRLNAQQTGQATEYDDFDSKTPEDENEATTVPRP